MHTFTIGLVFSSVLTAAACHEDQDHDSPEPHAARKLIPQIAPPLDLKRPPADATKTSSGLIYTKLAASETGAAVQRGDTVLVHYTAWSQRTGDTFFTTKVRGQPIALDLTHAAAGFQEALPLLRRGEKMMMWVPPAKRMSDTLVYEVEIVEILPPEETVAKQ
jgi:FKBP-type peptidyl-prolyl cis-trans isomerase